MRKLILVGLMALALAACDDAEGRADKHFKAAVALIDEGDLDRGIVELRNVFKFNKDHHEARRLFAATLRQKGQDGAAFAQYLRLVEQYPDDIEGLRALADLAFASGDGNEARIRVDAALAAQPDDPELQAYDAMLDYATAGTGAGDPAARAAAVAQAQALLADTPGLLTARRVVIADMIERLKFDSALREIEAGLALDPDARVLYAARLTALQQLGDKAGVEATLKEMIALFPEDKSFDATLVRWYIAEDRPDDAEAWLRGRITEGETSFEPRLTLIQFLARLRGEAEALAELNRVLALDPLPSDVVANLATFQALRAGQRFAAGQSEEAIEELQALLAAAGPEEPETEKERDRINGIKVVLAHMLSVTGNQVGARALIEEVLVSDSANAAALKQKGQWLIEDDLTDEGIATLREALNAAPRDSTVMTLLAKAYERQGNRQLVGQMLSQAVELSNRAPEESIRYARFLMQDKAYLSVEDVLIQALRLDSANLQLLSLLSQVHLAMQDWPRTEGDIARMREIARLTRSETDRDTATKLANEMQARMLAARGDTDNLIGFLQSLADSARDGSADEALGAEAAVIRSLVTAGKVDEALERSQALVAAEGDNPQAKYVLASVLRVATRDAEAEDLLREVVASDPEFQAAWTMLYQIRMRADDPAGAMEVLDAAEAALPNQMSLQWARAGLLERQGDVEGALALYEAMYQQNTNAPVIANNLASLLASTRQDAESLERAWAVARRLKGTEVPAFADTYGWIAHRRGQNEEALPYLERAAEGLPQDPTVQYHLGRVYAALDREDDARAVYARAQQRLAEGHVGIPGLEALLEEALTALGGG